MNNPELISKAKKHSILVAVILLIPVYFLVWIIGGIIYFAAGGNFGGLGAAASAGDAWWQTPAAIADYIFGLWIFFLLVRHSYRSYIRKHST
jgi:hypothetical protein